MATRKPPSIERALQQALRAIEPQPADRATVVLARHYAAEIDAGSAEIGKIGPLLLAVLVELRMTPKARAAVVKGGGNDDSGKRAAMDELRARREHRTTSVDTPAP